MLFLPVLLGRTGQDTWRACRVKLPGRDGLTLGSPRSKAEAPAWLQRWRCLGGERPLASNPGRNQLDACQFYGLLNQKVSSYLSEDILVEHLMFSLSSFRDRWRLAD